ncbi:glycoside hydrolase family 20 protein [Peniophora sp. CONT]|nr:glycoside hydrolase family 20 protein [Peniophora sp. CONT]
MGRLSRLFLLLAASLASVDALWPQPQSIQSGQSPLKLHADFSISLDVASAPSDLHDAVSRTHQYLKTDKLGRLVPDRGASDAAVTADAPALRSLVLELGGDEPAHSITEESRRKLEDRDEAYTLIIPADGEEARARATSTLGLLRALSTFEQIWFTANGEIYTLEAPYTIIDEPAYPYRGFMLDTSRNFFPVDDIKRTMDAMYMTKLNMFHWHIVDSQSFPLQIPGFMQLAEKGAYDADSVYTPEDVQTIIDYAGERGIDVVVEIDVPGHTGVISHAHPEHIACFGKQPWEHYAAEPPAGQLRLASQSTVSFTSSLLRAAAKMFPGAYFSTGGDEVNMRCYEEDEDTAAELAEKGLTAVKALDGFTEAVHGALKEEGKTPVVWQEMVLNYAVSSLSPETLVMIWISSAHAAAIASQNYRIVHSPSDYFYLDCGTGGWLGDDPTGISWCDPFKTWQKAYTFDPLASLSPDQHHLVMGGQSLLWAEQADSDNLDQLTWPRAAAAAEVFWTGGKRGSSKEALGRIHEVAFRMKKRGVRASPLQPHWCATHPGECDRNWEAAK